MKASKILQRCKMYLDKGIGINSERNTIFPQVKTWIAKQNITKSNETYHLFCDIYNEISMSSVWPNSIIHNRINEWLAKHEAKKAKRKKAAKANLQNEEAIAAIREATLLMDKVLQIKKAKQESKKAAFKNGGICADSTSQEGVLGQGERVITVAVNADVERIQAAAKRFANCRHTITWIRQSEKPQQTKPRPFQAGDKVKVKGRTGVHEVQANPDYLHRSDFPLIIELSHFNGTIVQEEFTETGHWLVAHQEEGLPPVLELVEKEQPNPDEPKRYEISFKFNAEPSPEAKAFVEELAKGENGADQWACATGTLPEKGQRVVVEMANGDKNYGTYTGNGVFWVVVPLEYHDPKGVWRDYKFPYVRKWKAFG